MVFTDGRSNDPENVPKQANALKDSCSAVFAFGIGSKINEDELHVSSTVELQRIIRDHKNFLR